MQFFTDLVLAGGVLDLSTAGANMKIVERGAGANMSVDVSAGRCFVKGTGNCYPVRNTDAINAVVTSNSSGNPRIDAVAVYIDLAESPTTTADDVAKIAVVAGTPATSPVAPTDSEIQTAVGGSNPFLRLAEVAVADSETQIQDADITDKRVQFRTKHMLNPTTTTYGASLAIDVGLYNDQIITLTGNLTITAFNNYTIDVPFIMRFVQDGTGGRTVSWPSNMDWFGGGTPVVTPTANKKDSFMIIPRSNSRFEGYIMGQSANIS